MPCSVVGAVGRNLRLALTVVEDIYTNPVD